MIEVKFIEYKLIGNNTFLCVSLEFEQVVCVVVLNVRNTNVTDSIIAVYNVRNRQIQKKSCKYE